MSPTVPSFERNEDGSLAYTKEGAHSTSRIIFHEDVTGKEITSTLLREVQKLSNVELLEYTTLVDILEKDNRCYGAVIRRPDGSLDTVTADLYCSGKRRSRWTLQAFHQFPPPYRRRPCYCQAGIILNCKIRIMCRSIPTTFYTKHPEDRSFLISESVRGEGARLIR